MTAVDLRDILLSTDFKTGLEELSSYLASIMQEAPIVHLLAKCLWKQQHLYALERNKRHDLTVWPSPLPSKENETTLEFKFNYETCSEKLGKELGKLADTLGANPPAIVAKLSNWGVVRRIWEDVCDKNSGRSGRSPFRRLKSRRTGIFHQPITLESVSLRGRVAGAEVIGRPGEAIKVRTHRRRFGERRSRPHWRRSHEGWGASPELRSTSAPATLA